MLKFVPFVTFVVLVLCVALVAAWVIVSVTPLVVAPPTKVAATPPAPNLRTHGPHKFGVVCYHLNHTPGFSCVKVQ